MKLEPILEEVLRDYELPWSGIHGLSHWGRVLVNGLRLAESTGADTSVVTLFALFHDARRVNEDSDPGHGRRGAELAATLRGSLFEMKDEDFCLLFDACVRHTAGFTEAHVTVQTCWDADRLDLGRVGIIPQPERLCTEAARDPAMMEWANERAIAGEMPAAMREVWETLGDHLR